MNKTGIKATEEETAYLFSLLNDPVIMVGSYTPPDPIEECHKLALKHGLPEISGFYGIMKSGEFVTI